jgi:hypothetical protein
VTDVIIKFSEECILIGDAMELYDGFVLYVIGSDNCDCFMMLWSSMMELYG